MKNRFNLNLNDLSDEFNLLLAVLKTKHGKRIPVGFETEIDWELFLQLVKHHRVYPTVFNKHNHMAPKIIPPEVVQRLTRLYQNNTFQMLYLSGEIDKLNRLFSKNKVRTLFLKGPVLAVDLYGEISLRTSSDIDILIPLEELSEVEALLASEGYIKDEYIQTILNDWKWRHHHFTFHHPEKEIKVEIHWRLSQGPAKQPCFEELWKRKRKSSISHFPIYILGKEDLFFFLVTHGARHGWSRLRWLQDIDQMVKQQLDWIEVIKLLRKYQSVHIGGQALILASTFFETELIDEMTPLIEHARAKRVAQGALFYLKQMVNLHAEPLPIMVEKYHRQHLFQLMSHRQQLLFLLSFLYPYPIDAETMPLPKTIHFLYFPLRPFLCVWRKSTKQVLPRRI